MSSILGRRHIGEISMIRLSASYRVLRGALEWIGRHPCAVIVLPSIWLLVRYQPFWKDVDAVAQVLAAPGAYNVLHFPPIYCFLARIPFWVSDLLTRGAAPAIFSEQKPSLFAVQILVFCQHLGLWLCLRYLLFSVPSSDSRRGMAALLLTSVASFYTFAHTVGSEAMTAVSWTMVFAAGLRILLRTSSSANWVIYVTGLLLAIGSRTVNNVLLLWFPVTIACLICYGPLTRRNWPALRVYLRMGVLGGMASLAVAGTEKILVSILCNRFSTIGRSTDGATFSNRIGTLVAQLTPEENARFLAAALALEHNPNVRAAIQAQFEFGSYHLGADDEIKRVLFDQGWRGEQLEAEADRLILRATVSLYRAAPRKMITLIIKEFIRTWTPTSDFRVARAGPLATLLFARDEVPYRGSNLPHLPFFELAYARPMLETIDHDPIIAHWQNIPLIFWFLVFLAIGIGRRLRGKISIELFLGALAFVAVGTAADVASCIFAYGQPRYTLPLLTTVFLCGCLLLFGLDQESTTLAHRNRK
jgi:hypothetical protein